MSATTETSRAAHLPAVTARLTFPGVLRAEWIKLFSLRSTWWTLGITVVVMVLFGLLQASSVQYLMEDPDMASFAASINGAELVTSGYQFGMVTIAVLGALLITGEYSTGMIRSTLTTVPTRLPVLVAKAIALTLVGIVIGVISVLGAHLVSAPMLSEYDLVPAFDASETWQVYGGVIYFFVATVLLALGLGAIIRSTAGAVTAALGVLLLLPIVLSFVNLDWVQDVQQYLPSNAASSFISVSGSFASGDMLEPWQGVAVVAGWSLAALVIGGVLLRRRDA